MSRSRIINMYKQGKTQSQIAMALQLTLPRVNKVVREYYADVQAEKAAKLSLRAGPNTLPDVDEVEAQNVPPTQTAEGPAISEPSYLDETELPEQD